MTIVSSRSGRCSAGMVSIPRLRRGRGGTGGGGRLAGVTATTTFGDARDPAALFGCVTIQAMMQTTRAKDTDTEARITDQLIRLGSPDRLAGGGSHHGSEGEETDGSGGGFEGTGVPPKCTGGLPAGNGDAGRKLPSFQRFAPRAGDTQRTLPAAGLARDAIFQNPGAAGLLARIAASSNWRKRHLLCIILETQT